MSTHSIEGLKLIIRRNPQSQNLQWLLEEIPHKAPNNIALMSKIRGRLYNVLKNTDGFQPEKFCDQSLPNDPKLQKTRFHVRRYGGNQEIVASFMTQEDPADYGILTLYPDCFRLGRFQLELLMEIALTYFILPVFGTDEPSDQLASHFFMFNVLGDEEGPYDYFLIEPSMYELKNARQVTYEDVWSWTSGPNS